MDRNLQDFSDSITDEDDNPSQLEFDTDINFTYVIYVLVFLLTFAFTLLVLFTIFG